MNIGLNVLSASVVGIYQGTLAKLVAIAVFLPIISDMSGCAGNQAVAVSIRELTLGLIKPRDFLRVLRKELQVGVANGMILGLLLGLGAFAYGTLYSHLADTPLPVSATGFGLIVGLAMALNSVVAVAFGGLVPLALKGMKFDPALAAAPLLTTITDMCGFFLMLNFAGTLLRWYT
jgi:magnesium transporter